MSDVTMSRNGSLSRRQCDTTLWHCATEGFAPLSYVSRRVSCSRNEKIYTCVILCLTPTSVAVAAALFVNTAGFIYLCTLHILATLYRGTLIYKLRVNLSTGMHFLCSHTRSSTTCSFSSHSGTGLFDLGHISHIYVLSFNLDDTW